MKWQRNDIADSSRDESIAFAPLLVEDEIVREVQVEDELSLAMGDLKRQRCIKLCNVKKYSDSRFLVLKSNICESLLSRLGFALSERRTVLNPVKFESEMFLSANSDLWTRAGMNNLTT